MKQTNGKGAYPDWMLRKLVQGRAIQGVRSRDQIQPASLDLSLSSELYRLETIVVPYPGEEIRSIFSFLGARDHDMGNVLECNVAYLARCNERLNLPASVYGYCNPKSSVGRTDVQVRVIADGVSRFDSLPEKGFKGGLWVVIISKSHPILVKPDLCFTQLRLFNADTRLNETEMEIEFDLNGFLRRPSGKRLSYKRDIKIKDGDGSILMTLDLKPGKGIVAGWECRGSNRALDLSSTKGSVQRGNYFQPLRVENDRVLLEKGKFYILGTHEVLHVPQNFAAEVAPMDDRCGEFRSHYAGFADPGFEGILTLEVRPYEDITFRHGQPVARVKFERMCELPEKPYCGNYQFQPGPRLSKLFI